MTWASWTYLAGALAVWALIRFAGDRWWPTTLLLFGPRWTGFVPLIPLVPAAFMIRRKLLWALAGAFLIMLGPVSGLCVHVPTKPADPGTEARIRVLTCNVDGNAFNESALAALIAETNPDVMVFQEWGGDETKMFRHGGWQVWRHDSLCVVSRFPIRNAESLGWNELQSGGAVARMDLETPFGDVRLVDAHLATPRSGLEAILYDKWRGIPEMRENLEVRWHMSRQVRAWIDEDEGPLIIAGDLNMPDDSAIYRENWSEYTDAFAKAGWGWGPTKFTRWFGVRIDHVLCGPGWRPYRCWVGPDIGSDHRPVIADLEWKGTSE